MKIDILTLFPSMIEGVLSESILKRAINNEYVDINVVNFRDYSTQKHGKVDDYPFGGGAGMVLAPQPIFDCINEITKDTPKKPRVIMMCPQGEVFTQKKAEELATEEHVILLCGHYEGFDERIRENIVTDEISIGDYVLTGGELAAMVITDSIVRLIPGVIGKQDSHINDSHSTGLLEHPHYTRPSDYKGHKVPDVLISGNHKLIDEWRHEQSLIRTLTRRPDMLEKYPLTEKDKKILNSYIDKNNMEINKFN